jgi:hypothetical protein
MDKENINIKVDDEYIIDSFKMIIDNAGVIDRDIAFLNTSKRRIWDFIYNKYNLDKDKKYNFNRETNTIEGIKENKIKLEKEDSEKLNKFLKLFPGMNIGLIKVSKDLEKENDDLWNYIALKYMLDSERNYKFKDGELIEIEINK